jgi:uncharacterized protein YoxC
VSGGDIAALIAAVAFVALVVFLAVPILRLRHTVDAATRALTDLTDRTGPLLGSVNTTVDNVNVALVQAHTSLDEVNQQLARLDTITGHAAQVTANVANLTTIVSAAASNPLVKVAALSYGFRKATAKRRRDDEEREVRQELKTRRKAARKR